MFARNTMWVLVLILVCVALPARTNQAAYQADSASSAVPAALPSSPAALDFALVGRYTQADYAAAFDASAAEIVDHDPVTERLFVVNGAADTVDVLDISTPATPVLAFQIPLNLAGAAANSLTVFSNSNTATPLLAIAVEAPLKTDPGAVLFVPTDVTLATLPTVAKVVQVGALPDMIVASPDGTRVLTANEGEPNSYGQIDSVDPEGSVSIIDVSGGLAAIDQADVSTVGFSDFNVGGTRAAELPSGVRIYGPGASVAQDLEPEYITVSPDGATAYVTLQENNGLAIIDVASAEVSAILDLGLKDHRLPGNGLDASDRDNRINIANWPVFGMYQPDAIASYEVGGQVYLVTANEGDARDYDGFAEEVRVNDLTLNTGIFTDAATLQANENLGRLTVTNVNGQGSEGYEALWVLGGRSFTIWNATTGEIVSDSGDDFEQRMAAIYPANFNASNTNNERDNRSDNKGPEPEAVALGAIDGRFYAFIGLERVGGVIVYDISDPAAPTYVRYLNNRDFTRDPETDPAAGDLGPEGIKFVSAANSPAGVPLLIVANEVSGSVSIYAISAAFNPDGAGSLTLLHNNDGESDTLGNTVEVAPDSGYSNTMTETLTVGSVSAFKAVVDRERALARSLGNAVVNVYAGDAFLASADLQCTLSNPNGPVYDAIAQQQIGYTAHAIGNHEFDYTPDFLKRFIDAFGGTQPFIAANLDFSGEAAFAGLTTTNANGILYDPISDGRVIGNSLVYTDTATGQRFGIVGITTPALPTISSPRDVTVTPTISETATVAQQAIDNLDALGVKKIILVSHLQDTDNDIELIRLLRKVDIAVGGGGDERLSNPTIPDTQELLPGDSPASDDNGAELPYPLPVTDADNETVYLVTGDGNYKYAGRLDVVFNADGEVASIVNERSYPRRVVVADAAAAAVGISDAVVPDAGLVAAVETPVRNCLAALEGSAIARSEVELNVSRPSVRGGESNAGNLITDAFLYAYNQYADNVSLPISGTNVIAIQNGGGIRQNAGDVLPRPGVPISGTITALDTFNVLPFVNFITVVQAVTAEELKSILERSAASLPGEGGQFLQIAGFEVVYAPNRPVGSRVVSATLADGTALISNGLPVADAPSVSIVTNSFTAGGGDNYETLANIADSRKVNLKDDNGFEITYEQPLREYLQSFAVSGEPSLPTIPADDARYAPGGEGRITLVQLELLYLPAIFNGQE